MSSHPTRWCSRCEIDWPALQLYNLCPKCGRNTAAETADAMPDQLAAAALRAKYVAFEDYLKNPLPELEAALERTPTIPDPTPDPPIAGRRYPQPPKPKTWGGDDA